MYNCTCTALFRFSLMHGPQSYCQDSDIIHLTHSLGSQFNNIIELSMNLIWMSSHVASKHFSHTL